MRGSVGTFIDVCAAHLQSKLIIAVTGSGGVADQSVDTYLDDHKRVKVIGMEDPKKAVKKALKQTEYNDRQPSETSRWRSE